MKRYFFGILVVIGLFLGMKGSNMVVINSKQLIIFDKALTEFKKEKFPIEKYEVIINEEENIIEITFLPIVDSNFRGSPAFGKEVKYKYSIDGNKLILKTYGR